MSVRRINRKGEKAGRIDILYRVHCDGCTATADESIYPPRLSDLAHLLRAGWGLEGERGGIGKCLCPQCMQAKVVEACG